MKNMALIIMALLIGSQCYAQSKYQKSSDKIITAAVDTTVITANDNIGVELFITNTNNVDTLQFRTELETTYRTLLPLQSMHFNKIFAKKIFRKAKTLSTAGIYSQLTAN